MVDQIIAHCIKNGKSYMILTNKISNNNQSKLFRHNNDKISFCKCQMFNFVTVITLHHKDHLIVSWDCFPLESHKGRCWLFVVVVVVVVVVFFLVHTWISTGLPMKIWNDTMRRLQNNTIFWKGFNTRFVLFILFILFFSNCNWDAWVAPVLSSSSVVVQHIGRTYWPIGQSRDLWESAGSEN